MIAAREAPTTPVQVHDDDFHPLQRRLGQDVPQTPLGPLGAIPLRSVPPSAL